MFHDALCHNTSNVVSSCAAHGLSSAAVGSTISTVLPPQQNPHPLRRAFGAVDVGDAFPLAGVLPTKCVGAAGSGFFIFFFWLYRNMTCSGTGDVTSSRPQHGEWLVTHDTSLSNGEPICNTDPYS